MVLSLVSTFVPRYKSPSHTDAILSIVACAITTVTHPLSSTCAFFAGTGNGGMLRVDLGVTVDSDHLDDTNGLNYFIKIPLDSLEGHGAFWHMDCKVLESCRRLNFHSIL